MTSNTLLIIMTLTYILPYLIAWHRNHNSKHAIGVTALLLGWTMVGWLFAFIWAFTGNVGVGGSTQSGK